jgi:hypothetical protein
MKRKKARKGKGKRKGGDGWKNKRRKGGREIQKQRR